MISPAVNSIHHHKGQIAYFTWMNFSKIHLIHAALIQRWGQRDTTMDEAAVN